MIEAFVSRNVPEEFVQTRMDLLNLLREFEKISRGKITVKVYPDIEPLTEEAERAEQQYGIVPQEVFSQSRGMWKQDQIYLAAAITCGSGKNGYSVFRARHSGRIRIGALAGSPSRSRSASGWASCKPMPSCSAVSISQAAMPQQKRKERLVEELEKQYDVVRVDPNNPITETIRRAAGHSALVARARAITNFIDAVKRGQPTAIFEDPLPGYIAGGTVPGTGMPKRSRQNPMMPFCAPPPEAKGDIKQLWDLLGVEMVQENSPWRIVLAG